MTNEPIEGVIVQELTKTEAEALHQQLNEAMTGFGGALDTAQEFWDRAVECAVQAQAGSIWTHYNHADWRSYVTAELPKLQLTKPHREELVDKLDARGLNTRDIAAIVGVAQSTVMRDLTTGRESNGSHAGNPARPETKPDTMGRQQPTKKPRRKLFGKKSPLDDAVQEEKDRLTEMATECRQEGHSPNAIAAQTDPKLSVAVVEDALKASGLTFGPVNNALLPLPKLNWKTGEGWPPESALSDAKPTNPSAGRIVFDLGSWLRTCKEQDLYCAVASAILIQQKDPTDEFDKMTTIVYGLYDELSSMVKMMQNPETAQAATSIIERGKRAV